LAGLLLQVSVRWQRPGPKHQALRHWQLKPVRLERLRQLKLVRPVQLD
jgi:hypothetical protein